LKLKYQPMGEYQTNCYIVTVNGKDFIVDPGVGAASWVEQNVTNPVAILNTHGHFDHIWDNAQLKKMFNIPIVIHKSDAFFLEREQFGIPLPKSKADIEVEEGEIEIAGEKINFLHFPGHTPGSCVIDFGDFWCSGDFIFEGSIGRVDFPFSDPQAMKESLKRFKAISYDKPIYPGHGNPTTIKREQQYVNYWLKAL